MNKDFFILHKSNRQFHFEIEAAEMHWCIRYFDEPTAALFINIRANYKEAKSENYPWTTDVRIYTEWLNVPRSAIKNKDLKTLEQLNISYEYPDNLDFCADNEETIGALYTGNHEAFDQAEIALKYCENGQFYIRLKGKTEFETTFDVAAVIPLEVKLTAYDKRATKEDIQSYFDDTFNKEDFECDWRHRDDDIFFTAKPLNNKN